jgi:hypothetical protein
MVWMVLPPMVEVEGPCRTFLTPLGGKELRMLFLILLLLRPHRD